MACFSIHGHFKSHDLSKGWNNFTQLLKSENTIHHILADFVNGYKYRGTTGHYTLNNCGSHTTRHSSYYERTS